VAVELPTVHVAELAAATPEEHWLVRDLWGRESVGIVGGAPKCCKSFFVLDLAVSVASGTPCLGHFPVDDPGRALVYLAEDPLPEQRTRIDTIVHSRGLCLDRLDLRVVTVPVLRLDLPADRDKLQGTLARLRPKLLVLDPLVRIHRLDENSAQEISGLLSFLREIQRTHAVAVALVHHASKKHRARPGQALRGSSDIHAFGDDLAHLARPNEHDLVLSVEHRSAPAFDPIRVQLVTAGDGAHLALVDAPPERVDARPIEDRVLAALGDGVARTRQDLRAVLRVNNHRLGEALGRLQTAGQVIRTPTGWTVPSSLTEPPAGQRPLFE
jgi:hypothetical protein